LIITIKNLLHQLALLDVIYLSHFYLTF